MVETITRIRQSKLPDPDRIGNAGSFFKNPILSSEDAQRLKQAEPEMPKGRKYR